MAMLSTWSVLWAAFAFVIVSAAPDYYGNYAQPESIVSIKSDSSADFDCSGKDNGAYGVVGCSKDYWLCWDGATTSQECPLDLMFNDANGQCDYPANVFACSGVLPTPTLASDNAVMAPVDFDCSGLEDGDYSFSQSCQVKYVSCVAGAPWVRSCPDNLSFDFENRICDRLEHIIACGGSPPTAPTVNDVPVLVMFDCPTPSGSFAVPSALCSATYYVCDDNVASIAICDDLMIFDDSNKQCSLPKDTVDCNFDCSGKADSAYSEGCSQYYWWCWEEKATKLACPDGMVFDGELIQCGFSANVVECGGVPTMPPMSDNATPMPVDFDCTNLEDGNHALNGDVCQAKFVSCVGGIAWGMDCPDGLMFDPDQMLCERIEAIVACGGTAEPITTAAYGYQTTTFAAEPATKSYGYQTPVKLPISQLRRHHQDFETVLKATTLQSGYDSSAYGSQTPAAEATTRRHIKKTTLAKPATRQSYQTTTPAAEPTTRRHIKKTTLAKPATRRSYQTTTPAAEPTTRHHIKKTTLAKPAMRQSYQTTTPAAEPTTESSYGDYQSENLAAESIARKFVKTDSGYLTKTLAAQPTARRQIKTATRQSYQTTTPAAEPTTESSYGSFQTETLAESTGRRLIKTNGGYQTPAVKPVIRHMKSSLAAVPKIRASYGYQTTTPAAEPTTRKSYGRQIFGSYQTPAAEPATRRHIEKTRQSYGFQTTTPAAEPTTRSSYDSYQTLTSSPIAAEPTRRHRLWYYKKVYVGKPTVSTPIKQQQSY